MSTKVLSSLNLSQNEIQNGVFQNLAAAPSSPKPGQFYFDTTLSAFGIYTGAAWEYISATINNIFELAGAWNANTNSPALTSGTGVKGAVYTVSTAGTTALDGHASWAAGDLALFDGAHWQHIDGQVPGTSFLQKFAANVGAMTAGVPLNIAHGLGTADITVQVVDNSGNEVLLDVQVSATNITLTSASAQAANALRVVAIG